jgi:subtilisin family serine protease
MKQVFFLLLFNVLAFTVHSQTQVKEKRKGWHLLDYKTDGYWGISLAKAYQFLNNKKSVTVTVAVIDSGIDTLHEDLKEILWVNNREVIGNRKDDDNNGYIDDIHGWNFCGSKNGENLTGNTHEIPRVYHEFKTAFENKKETEITSDSLFLYKQWRKAELLLNAEYNDAVNALPGIKRNLELLQSSAIELKQQLALENFTQKQLAGVRKKMMHSTTTSALNIWTDFFKNLVPEEDISSTFIIAEFERYKIKMEGAIAKKEQPPLNKREMLTQDNYYDLSDRFYGNNNLQLHSGNHGTGVASVIAAVRNNNKGMEGIADNVRMMVIRAAPGGDEYDKDIALAIRYAVDNGAQIINMSFGKPVSPHKKWVDDAVKYADSKNVLLVHAAGNDAKDISENEFYPSPLFIGGQKAHNMLSVGASGDESNGGLVASFSNYGKNVVDIFAPGVQILSATSNNGYEEVSGTSIAAPVVTGIAALLKSYYPHLKPAEIIAIIKQSGTTIKENVLQPGTLDETIDFSTLSSSGKIVNAYEAVKLAALKYSK